MSSTRVAGVGIVVVHYGDSKPTLAALHALRNDPSEVDRRIVVVDNSANLAGVDLLGAARLPREENPGFGAGANLGVAELGEGPWDALVVLNHDVEVFPGFLAAAAGAASRPGVGAAAGPLFLDAGRQRLWYGGGSVNRLTGTVRQVRSLRASLRERTVGFLPGAALALSEGAFRSVGGFDPEFFLYHEDLDLSLRLRRKGYRLLFVPGMAALHQLGAATGSAHFSPLYLEHLTRTRLRPFRPLAFRLYLAAIHTGYVSLRALAFLLRDGHNGVASARALWRGHRHALATLHQGPRDQG
jgi:GT2 family glycosyltransferase